MSDDNSHDGLFRDLMPQAADELSLLRLQKGVYLFLSLLTPVVYDFYKDEYNFEVSMRALSLKEQQKVRSIKDHNLKCKALMNRLFTRAILNRILSHYTGEEFAPFRELPLKYTSLGKPYLENIPFAFSSSSSNDVICIAVELDSSDQIGVDLSHSVQNISPTSFMSDFKDIFHTSEVAQLEALDSDNRYIVFNQLWTLKEAFTKLIGSGLNINLQKFHFNLNGQYIANHSELSLEHQGVYRLPVKWRKGITVNADDLAKHPIMSSISSDHYNCCCATIIEGKEKLPVIASIINQNSSVINVYNVNAFDIAKAVLEHVGSTDMFPTSK